MNYLVEDALDEWVDSFDYDNTVTEYITDYMKTFAAEQVAGS
jgi:hypothetical protein